jgi:hypothetical protein
MTWRSTAAPDLTTFRNPTGGKDRQRYLSFVDARSEINGRFGGSWNKLVQVKFRLPPETYDSEPPPILRTWRNVYIFVLGWLALLIVLFYLFTRYFA